MMLPAPTTAFQWQSTVSGICIRKLGIPITHGGSSLNDRQNAGSNMQNAATSIIEAAAFNLEATIRRLPDSF